MAYSIDAHVLQTVHTWTCPPNEFVCVYAGVCVCAHYLYAFIKQTSQAVESRTVLTTSVSLPLACGQHSIIGVALIGQNSFTLAPFKTYLDNLIAPQSAWLINDLGFSIGCDAEVPNKCSLCFCLLFH